MARVHYPTNAGQAWARGEAIGGDARLASEVPILLKPVVQSTDYWAQCTSHMISYLAPPPLKVTWGTTNPLN